MQQSVDWIIGPVSSIAQLLQRGTKSELAAFALPSQGPKSGRKCYVTLAFSGVPNKGDKIRSGYLTPTFSGFPKRGDKIKSGYLTPAFSGAHKWAELLRNPCIVRDPQQRGQNQEWLHWRQGQKCGYATQNDITKIIFPQMVCLHRKNPLKPPHRPF